jgi:hypothetical protein
MFLVLEQKLPELFDFFVAAHSMPRLLRLRVKLLAAIVHSRTGSKLGDTH